MAAFLLIINIQPPISHERKRNAASGFGRDAGSARSSAHQEIDRATILARRLAQVPLPLAGSERRHTLHQQPFSANKTARTRGSGSIRPFQAFAVAVVACHGASIMRIGRTTALPALLIALAAGAAAQEVDTGLSNILQTAENDSHGKYLVTAGGQPLYVFSADQPRSAGSEAESRCVDACAKEWPPLVSDAGAVASPDINPDLISKAERQDGSSQVLFAGRPLYVHAADGDAQAPGGHGQQAFGGVWQLVMPDGTPIQPNG
jgi:predicted lipoprotein with Yx(FWY)xxD motif